MLFASVAEVISIGAVVPFLGVLTTPSRVFEHPAAQLLVQSLGLTSASQLLLPLTIAFGLAAIISGGIRVLLLWATTRLSFAAGLELGINIYRRTLYQPYAVHVARNSSDIIGGITSKTHSVIYQTILPTLIFFSSSIMLIVILSALLTIDPGASLLFFGGFGFIYSVIIWLTRHRLVGYSQTIARETTQVLRVLQEGLGGIRDILLDGSQAAYCESYRKADLRLRWAQASNVFIALSPRYAMEALGMILIAGLAYKFSQEPIGGTMVLPILGALALGAQRLLPVAQQAYVAWAGIKGSQASLGDTLELLDQPLPEYVAKLGTEPLTFNKDLELKDLSFRYTADTPWVLRDITLTIPKGSRVGFIGPTGSGKSTLLDIIMGLLQPTSGTLAIDGRPISPHNSRAWQSRIAHVPQTVFLGDTTIAENIAFGRLREEIDFDRVRWAAQKAQIAEVIETWPDKYQTFTGERGIRLSGGQRQRIGIARALYKQADVIVFDEATSALDYETERAVMASIESFNTNITILIIAHRVTTLQRCTQIIELRDTGIIRICAYQDIAAPVTRVN